jgi:hypothetical protein
MWRAWRFILYVVSTPLHYPWISTPIIPWTCTCSSSSSHCSDSWTLCSVRQLASIEKNWNCLVLAFTIPVSWWQMALNIFMYIYICI